MATLFEKMILMYLCIAIACAFWQPDIVFGNNKQADSVLTTLFNIDSPNDNLTSMDYNHNTINKNTLSKVGSESSGTYPFQNLVDGLFNVLDVIMGIFNILFSPIKILVAGAFPIEILYIIGIPLVTMMLIAIIQAIRGNG